ncbi:MAG TPA: hypothetical protein VJU78_04345, partial [Chitinophagaceae bacterium]|nr:hypothetical protein [Chitinophagaceae bacterium]
SRLMNNSLLQQLYSSAVGEKHQPRRSACFFLEHQQRQKNNLKDADLLNMFTKVQQLDKTDLTTVKNLLKAFIFQKETQQRLAQ